jgi:pantothenate kinase type III
VGNTAVSCGLFPMDEKIAIKKPQKSWIFSTQDLKPNRYKKFLRREMKKGRIPLETVHDILISSVVPRVDRPLCKDLKALFSLTPLNPREFFLTLELRIFSA